MERRDALTTGEIYHIFNRGAGKTDIFLDQHDYFRFLILLHLANSTDAIHLGNLGMRLRGRPVIEFFNQAADHGLVGIHAYALMPNHFHLIVRQRTETGITQFMRKLATAYSMYFNSRHERSGVLFQGRFQSRYISAGSYERWIYSYVHLNPLSLVDPDWNEQSSIDKKKVRAFMDTYQFSSWLDYRNVVRPQGRVLDTADAPNFLFKEDDLEALLSTIKDRPLYELSTAGGRLNDLTFE